MTGGETTSTAVVSLNDAGKTWRSGPPLPYAINQGVTVPYEGNFLIVGGSSSGLYLNTILEYDAKAEAWVQRPETLKDPRARHAAMVVGADAVQCD